MPSPLSTIVTPDQLDLESKGRRAYRVALPYGRGPDGQPLLLPLVVIRNGVGPSVLVAGGTHGDEFEGQVAVADLARNTETSNVCRPAHRAAPAQLPGMPRRHAARGPDDGADLNRLFSADIPQGRPKRGDRPLRGIDAAAARRLGGRPAFGRRSARIRAEQQPAGQRRLGRVSTRCCPP